MQAVSSRQFVRIEAKDIMLNIVLVEPEIPMNTGNIARTCAATRSRLHLVRPLGFDISDRAVKRAGLDYWHMVDLRVYDSIEDLFHKNEITDLWLATTKAPRDYAQAQFRDGCWLFFGKETAGLPLWFRQAHPDRCLRIPMRPEARSLNLANSVGRQRRPLLQGSDPTPRNRRRTGVEPGRPADKNEKKGLFSDEL